MIDIKSQNSFFTLQVHKLVIFLFLSTAVFGYVLGFGKLYLFHLALVAYFLFAVLGIIKIRKVAVKQLFPLFALYLFMVCTLLWSPNLINSLYFLFYFFCGFSIIFVIVNYASNLERLDYVFKVIAIFMLLNFLVGALETTGYFRLPMSPYYGVFNTRPSGFNFNLNNFGFVFLAVFPFIFLYPNKYIKLAGVFLAGLFLIKLESKGFFLGLLAFFVFFLFTSIKQRKTWIWLAPLSLIGLIAVLFMVLLGVDNLINLPDNRSFTAFSQIEKSLKMIDSGDLQAKDSTSIRTTMYLHGLNKLIETNGLGLGLAGIGTDLADKYDFFTTNGKEMFKFHNFFLEMLIDLGAIPFMLFFYLYLKIAIKLIAFSKTIDGKLKFYSKASGLSMLTIVPASISPSSIIYVLSFYLVIGFSLAAYYLVKKHVSERHCLSLENYKTQANN